MESKYTSIHHSPKVTGNTLSKKEEIWKLGDALMEFHLRERDMLGDESEMSPTEIAEITGVPVRDIIETYNSAISKLESIWTKTT